MNELDRVRSSLCSFWTGLIKWIHKKILKNRNIQGPYLLLVNDAISTSVLTQPSTPEQPCFLEMKAAQRPRNALLMWYPLVLVVKIGRDINNPQQKETAMWTSPFGKNTSMASSHYGPSPLLSWRSFPWECLHTEANGQAPPGSSLKGKEPVRTVILSLASVTHWFACEIPKFGCELTVLAVFLNAIVR